MAELMIDLVKQQHPLATGEVVALVNKVIEPCIGCGCCVKNGACVIPDDFSSIYNKISLADGIVFVAPHYAPIPAKLCALLERIESIAFLNRWNDPAWSPPLQGKPVVLIGHGGAVGDDMQKFYNDVVLIPLKNALGYPVEAQIVRVEEWPYIGVITGPSAVHEGGIFPIQEFNWQDIEKKFVPLAASLCRAINVTNI